MKTVDPIELEILWNRLIAIVDEAAAALVRTSFSTVVRESNDFACVLLDENGYCIAQSTLSVAGFIGTAPLSLRKFLETIPKEQLRPGDVLFSNDPWIGTGHLPDSTMAAPIYLGSKLIGFIVTVAHLSDVGGRQWSADANEVFEEGVLIPVTKLYSGGKLNTEVLQILKANVRLPDQVLGDIDAQVVAIHVATKRLRELMREKGLTDLRSLSRAIFDVSARALGKEIQALPPGTYVGEVEADGWDTAVRIRATVTIKNGKISIDYAGSSPQSRYGINESYNHTFAYTVYPFKCMLSPTLPNNEGFLRLFEVIAPVGSIVNSRRPAAVGARQLVGHLLQGAIFKAMEGILPDRVQADSGTPLWTLVFRGVDPERDRAFSSILFFNGGTGAMMGQSGSACTSFPGNISNTSIEVVESLAPLLYRRKAIDVESGGNGKWKGGAGQVVHIESRWDSAARVSLLTERTRTAPQGLHGGLPGKVGFVRKNGAPIQETKGIVELQRGDVLEIGLPGGGGFGKPEAGDPQLAAHDRKMRYRA